MCATYRGVPSRGTPIRVSMNNLIAGMPVEVYYNLHKGCLSVRRRERGARVEHAHAVVLQNAVFAVQPAGVRRARASGQKNVHAFVRGVLVYVSPTTADAAADADAVCGSVMRAEGAAVTYDPFSHDSFVYVESGDPAVEAEFVSIVGRRVRHLSHSPI